jgi:hypothetical protein
VSGRTGLSSQEATRELTTWLTSQLPALPADQARALVEQACGRCPGVLLEYVRERPFALADPAPRPPLAAVRLAHALYLDGHDGITLPPVRPLRPHPGPVPDVAAGGADLRPVRRPGPATGMCTLRPQAPGPRPFG